MKLRTYALLGMLLISGLSTAQAPAPQLSTADKIAINTLEKTKQDARKSFEDAQAAEDQMRKEFATANPGWHITAGFIVEADAKPEVKK